MEPHPRIQVFCDTLQLTSVQSTSPNNRLFTTVALQQLGEYQLRYVFSLQPQFENTIKLDIFQVSPWKPRLSINHVPDETLMDLIFTVLDAQPLYR